jgi:signal peptidase I
MPSRRWLAIAFLPLILGAAIFAVERFAFIRFTIPSGSMRPTLQKDEIVFGLRAAFDPRPIEPGEIVVFRPPVEATRDYIKRVVALPGDRIEIWNGNLFRNGALEREDYLAAPTPYTFAIHDYGFFVDGIRLTEDVANLPERFRWTRPDAVPAGCYLLLGDAREDSDDSHVWGCAQTSGPFASGPMRGAEAHLTARVFARIRKGAWSRL